MKYLTGGLSQQYALIDMKVNEKRGDDALPRNKEQNEEIRSQRRETIIRGALKVYVEKGYAAAEIGDVAEQAGVARGLVYYYFKDKLALFRELFMYMFDQSQKHLHSHFDKEDPVCEILEKFVSSMYNNMLEQSEGIQFFMRMRHDLHELFKPDELKNLTRHVEYLQAIQNTLKRGMESGEIRQMAPKLLAAQYWGAVMHGMMYLRQLNQELQDLGKSKAEITKTIKQDITDAIACCMSLVAPPLQVSSKGDEEL
jgi:TetR/AcrR family transcriptional regulator